MLSLPRACFCFTFWSNICMKAHIGMKSLTKVKEQADRGTCNAKSSCNKCRSCIYGALLVAISQGSFFPVSVYITRLIIRNGSFCFVLSTRTKRNISLPWDKTVINCVISSHLRWCDFYVMSHRHMDQTQLIKSASSPRDLCRRHSGLLHH